MDTGELSVAAERKSPWGGWVCADWLMSVHLSSRLLICGAVDLRATALNCGCRRGRHCVCEIIDKQETRGE